VGVGAAFGPLVLVPARSDEPVRIGGRYMPTVGDALGAWGIAPCIGGAFDVTATPGGDVRFLLALTLGIDGNFGRPFERASSSGSTNQAF
jgi:hypothetical protein